MVLAHLKNELRMLGHRNWLLIADAAFPKPSSPTSNLLVLEGDLNVTDVVQEALLQMTAQGHVRPVAIVARELDYVGEDYSPGSTNIRHDILGLLYELPVERLSHADILDIVGSANYPGLIVKTNTKIPYTSVLLRLECGYWSDEAEADLRARMGE